MTEKNTSNSTLKGLEIYEKLIENLKQNEKWVSIRNNNVIHCNRIKKNEEQEE